MSTQGNNAAKVEISLSKKSVILNKSLDGDAVSVHSSSSSRQMSFEGSCCSEASADEELTAEDIRLGAKNDMCVSELGESIALAPDITIFCQICQRYIDISDLKEHGSYHEALKTFQYRDLAQVNLSSLTSRRKALIKEMLMKQDSCKTCLDPMWLRKLDDSYEIIKAELENNAIRVSGVNSHEVCGFSFKCETMQCIKAIGSCGALNKRWKNVMDEENTFQNCFGGDPTKCFLGIYSGYNGSNAAETSARELHKFVQSEIQKFEKYSDSDNQLEDAAVNGLCENKKEIGHDSQGKQLIHDITNSKYIPSPSSDGSKATSENVNAMSDVVTNRPMNNLSAKKDATHLLLHEHNKEHTYARKVSDAHVTAHRLVDEILSSGKGETSRVRWSGCSTLTCLVQSHEDDTARDEASDHDQGNDQGNTTKELEGQGTPNGDRFPLREILDAGDHQIASEQMHFHQRTHLATIHLANAGDARAVLVRRNKPTRLSTVHTPANEKERQRITKLGGTVNPSHKDFRLNGVLATTRGLGNHGDRLLKKCIINTPFTASIPVDKFCQFLILASNGVWQILSEEEAAALLLQMLPCQSIPPPSIISTTIDYLLRGGNNNRDSFIANFEEDNSTSSHSLHFNLNDTSKDLGKGGTDMHCVDENLQYLSETDSSQSKGNSIAGRSNTLDKTSTAYECHVIENSNRTNVVEHLEEDSSSQSLEGCKPNLPSVSRSPDNFGCNGHRGAALSEIHTQTTEMNTAEEEPLCLSRLMAERLVEAALMAGTKDNVTVTIILFNDSISHDPSKTC